MLFALGHPLSLLVLLVSFVCGVTLHGALQALVADRLGDRRPRQERRLTLDPRQHLDPFGAVAAALAGTGWGRPVEPVPRRGRAALVAVTASGPLANVLLGIGLLALARSVSGTGLGEGASFVLQHGVVGLDPLATALLLGGASQLYLGVLSLVPLPPLDGGRLLFGLAPRTTGWQRAEHLLVEQNGGTVALLVLLVLPLGGSVPVLLAVLDAVLAPLLRVLAGV